MVFVMQVIIAEGEQKASHALRQAAEVIGGSPAALQVSTVRAVCTIMGIRVFSMFPH